MATPTPRALIIATAAATFAGHPDKPAGCWAEELCVPYQAWTAAGYDVDIATPGGKAVPWTPVSLQGDAKPKAVDVFMKDSNANGKAEKPLSLADVDISREYAIVYVPGGHGAMVDLPENERAQQLLRQAWQHGAVLASVCHGPAALVRLADADAGAPLLKGKRVACFTNEEEKATGLQDVIPFLLEDEVKRAGAIHEAAPPGQAHVVRDGRLVTGQNPASSAKLAEVALEAAREVAKQYE
jgi:putative intracellular protease/amidase